MNPQKECLQFRETFEEHAPNSHLESCAGCRQWKLETDSLMLAAESLPQFDVPEKLTQSILAAVNEESRQPLFGHYGLLLPVGVVCGVACFTLLPVDSPDGFAATGVALAMLFIINLLLRADKSVDSVAS